MIDKNRLYLSTIDPAAGDAARQYGLGIEIAEFCTAWNLDRELPATRRLLESTLAQVGNRIVHGPFNELFPCAIDPKARELAAFRYSQAITIAREYGAKKVVLHGGFNPWLYYPQWYEEQSILFWREFMDCVPRDMIVCVENVLEPEPQMLLSIVREVENPGLRLCLDVGHVNAYSRVPADAWLEACGDYLSHLHIHNNDGTADTHSALYTGTLPVKRLLEKAMENPDITATLELPECLPSVRWLLEEETWKEN